MSLHPNLLHQQSTGKDNHHSRNFIVNIQILRFIAAFWVAFYHVKVPGNLNLPRILFAIQKAGFVGMDIFFVISGVIMAVTTHYTPSSLRSGARFLVIRYARIYSGWWPFFLLYLLIFSLIGWSANKNLLGSFFLYPLPLDKYLVAIVWTLSFELYFYTVIACLLPLALRTRTTILAMLFVLLAGFVIWSAQHGFYTPARFAEGRVLQHIIAFPLVAEFLAGFLLYEWICARKPRKAWPWIIAAAIFFTAAACFQKLIAHKAGFALEGYFGSHWRALLVGGFALCLVAATLIAKPWSGIASKFMATLGDASYAIYLGHILVWVVIAHAFNYFNWYSPNAQAWSYVLTLAAILVYSVIHFRYVERPLYRVVRHTIDQLIPSKA